ncbi:MAG: hypothetical protein AVDCRST_MAG85-236, partial [uncultured Solirubrobacteraceae bacterium]
GGGRGRALVGRRAVRGCGGGRRGGRRRRGTGGRRR